MLIRPFPAIHPLPNLAARVACPPYDVVDDAEARALGTGNPHSFIHVVRSEIDLPPGTDPYDPAVYARARDNLGRFLDDGVLVRAGDPRMYLYRLAAGGRTQLGLVCSIHVNDYDGGAIRRHEKTRRDKEDDRTRHILAIGAHAGPVLLACRDDPDLSALARDDTGGRPLVHFDDPDGVTHTVWKAADPGAYVDSLASIERLYIADGHHRAASASRAAAARREANPRHRGDEPYNWFLAAIFPAAELTILPYNRLVTDIGRLGAGELLRLLAGAGRVSSAGAGVPGRPGAVGVYLDGAWRELELEPADRDDPIGSLDVSMLQERVLGPMLDIDDPRADARLQFAGGAAGSPEALRRRVDAGEAAVAFSMHPTSVEQLLAVADAGLIMPPKSTWFDPKLRSGLFVHPID